MMISESIRHCSNRSHDEEEGRAGMVFQPSAERLFRRKQPEKGSVSVGV